MTTKTIKALLGIISLGYITYLIASLSWVDSLTSMGNDSVHYLAMARHYSFWVAEPPAIAAAWPLQDFPPFFPWLLALTGAAHSLLYAHVLVSVMAIASLFVLYRLAHQWLQRTGWSILMVIVFALSPGFILGMQGILSESLYLLLTIIFLLLYRDAVKLQASHVFFTAILLTAILLTRTIGIALCMALVMQAVINSIANRKLNPIPFLPVIISLMCYFLLMKTLGPVKESHYTGVLVSFVFGDGLKAIGTGAIFKFSVFEQSFSLLYNWVLFWILEWTEQNLIMRLITYVLLLFSLTGLLLRLRQNRLDAWYATFFLLVLFVWPHPGQLFRLLLPVVPLLVLYAGYALIRLERLGMPVQLQQRLPYLFFFSMIGVLIPPHILINLRTAVATEEKLVPIYESFRRIDSNVSALELLYQNQMLKDFGKITETVAPSQKVIYFLPSYVAVLSERISINAPTPVTRDGYQKIAREHAADFIFLTRLHPRFTGLGYSGFRGIEELKGWTRLEWCSRSPDKAFASCLYRITDF